ncbi:hypothetical protein N7456_011290 [Penicillium angulare]|uniref:RZ-type domain-containing protein n=1 Tax=Penicillium angulare TaxID=116970 RepID=A0A9W9JZJ6_9EURO|nr:hypothetical protein N7456_011290 [Penicillium angulare]
MESVDGLVDLDAVYRRDEKGKFDALQDISSSLASAIPSCPDCRQPIRQFATKRYNRVVNRAIMDEIYRRFLTKGRVELESLQSRVNAIEDQSNSTSLESPEDGTEVYKACDELQKEALDLSKAMEAENPMKRLIDIIAIHKKTSMREIAASLSESKDMDSSERESHNQITLDARLIYVKVQEIRYSHVFKLINRPHGSEKTSAKRVERLTIAMGNVLEHCHELIAHAEGRRLYRIAITATISFAKISQLQGLCHRLHNRKAYRQSKDTEGAGKYVNCFEIARGLVAAALKLCGELGNCPELQEAVEEMARLYEGPRYEKITFEELQSIKTAMVSGREGMATHCGHWYNCANGHPFAIGECGMPMEQATCPECGAPIGGQDHRAVEGVSRARYME